MKAMKKWLYATLVLCAAGAADAGGEKMKVRLAFPPGDYLMTTVSQSQGSTETGGEKSPSKDDSREVWRMQVPEPNDQDEKKVLIRLVEARTEGLESGQQYRFDSTRQGQQTSGMEFAYAPLMKAEVLVTLDADDTVVEVSGLDKLWTDLDTKAHTPMQQGLLAEMRIAKSDKGFESNFRRLEALMPKAAIAVGDAWKAGVRMDLPLVGELKVRYDCKLVALEPGSHGDVAVIEANSTYSLSKPKTIEAQGVALTLRNIEMAEKARVKIDVQTGIFVSDESTRSVSVQGIATQADQQQEVSSQNSSHTTTTLTPTGAQPPRDSAVQAASRAGADTGRPSGWAQSQEAATPATAAQATDQTDDSTQGLPMQGEADNGDRPALTAPPPAASSRPSSAQPPAAPGPLVMRRQAEPRQNAFSVLVPQGWLIEGGLFSVDPTQAGGALNAIETKCDFSVKRDTAGTVMVRWAPSYNFVDWSRAAEFASLAQLFPPGRTYNGALVKPMPTVEQYLMEGFKLVRPKATDVRVIERIDLPMVADLCTKLSQGVNAQMAQLGKPPMTFTAGALVIEYTEGGNRYREAALTALGDWRAAAGIWSNQFTFHMRAPAAQETQWKPVLDIVRQSLKFNPQWVAAYVRAAGERGQAAAALFRSLERIDQEIFAHRSAMQERISEDNYLLLTGQEKYVNPYTREVEQDSSDYRFRWTTPGGDRLYSQQDGFDPNRDAQLNQLEWKLTPVEQR
jgi:hypothetical protein